MTLPPHEWKPSPYGHGSAACKHCHATPEELGALGEMNGCQARAETPAVTWDQAREVPEVQSLLGALTTARNALMGHIAAHAALSRLDILLASLEPKPTPKGKTHD